QRGHRPRERLGGRHRPSMGLHGRSLRRLLRRARGSHQRLPLHLLRGRGRDRPGSRARRVLALEDRRLRGRAHRRARRRQRAGADLARRANRRGAVITTAPLFSTSLSADTRPYWAGPRPYWEGRPTDRRPWQGRTPSGHTPGRTRLGSLRVPAAALLLHLAFMLEPGQYPVEVVLLDAHLGSELGDCDPGLSLHEREGLGGPGAAAFAASCTAFAGGASGFFASSFRRGGGRRARTADRPTRTPRSAAAGGGGSGGGSAGSARAAHSGERRRGRLAAVVLVHEGLQLCEPIGDLAALLVKKVSHGLNPLH